jgi:WD40 repeat protein
MQANKRILTAFVHLSSCLVIWASLPSIACSQDAAKPVHARMDTHGDSLPKGAVARLGTLRFRYPDALTAAIAFSPDGRRIACGGFENTRIFEVPSGRILRILPNLKDTDKQRLRERLNVEVLNYRKDGTVVAVAGNGQTAVLYEPESGKVIKRFPLEGSRRALSADQRYLAKIDGSGFEVDVIDLVTGKRVYKVGSQEYLTFHATFSPNNQLLATSEVDEKASFITIWDASNGKEVRRIALKGASAYEALFSPDGKRLIVRLGTHISIADDFEPVAGAFQLTEFDVATGKELRKLGPRGMHLSSLCVSADGNTLAGLIGKTVRLFDLRTSRLIDAPPGLEADVKAIAFTPDGRTVVAAGGDSIRFFDPTSGRQKQVLVQKDGIGAIAFSENAEVAVFENKPGAVFAWYLPGDRLLRTFTMPTKRSHWSGHLNVYGDSDILAVLGTYAGDTCRFWNIHSGVEQTQWKLAKPVIKQWRHFKDEERQISAIAIDKRAGKVAQAFADTLVVLEFVGGKEIWRAKADDGSYISRLKISPDGQWLISGDSHEGIVRVWNLDSGKKCDWAIEPPGRNVITGPVFAISTDSKTIATGGQDGAIRLWDIVTGKERRSFSGHEGWVTFLRYAPDGKSLASGSEDTTVLIWDFEAPAR